jgi:small nuclear ribonucleoprotein (snRNP)-like protein
MKEKSYFKLLNKIVSIELRNNRAMFGDVVAI